ncbi:hypothetical protein Taro_016428 [Colocasia esculenta]|uniref:Uncharacterized protein n=1 Tax=Colocasia esculenta TaxID=4460 RepID=A0A843UKC1_COLES|nr:hypothetical protein [Colocasia esculenta]
MLSVVTSFLFLAKPDCLLTVLTDHKDKCDWYIDHVGSCKKGWSKLVVVLEEVEALAVVLVEIIEEVKAEAEV